MWFVTNHETLRFLLKCFLTPQIMQSFAQFIKNITASSLTLLLKTPRNCLILYLWFKQKCVKTHLAGSYLVTRRVVDKINFCLTSLCHAYIPAHECLNSFLCTNPCAKVSFACARICARKCVHENALNRHLHVDVHRQVA